MLSLPRVIYCTELEPLVVRLQERDGGRLVIVANVHVRVPLRGKSLIARSALRRINSRVLVLHETLEVRLLFLVRHL